MGKSDAGWKPAVAAISDRRYSRVLRNRGEGFDRCRHVAVPLDVRQDDLTPDAVSKVADGDEHAIHQYVRE